MICYTLFIQVYISGLSEFRVQTEEDVMQLLEVGMRNRSTKTTDYNDTSSRSHAILQISFELEKQSESGQTMLIRSKLSFADLAGSEKMSASNEVSEAKHIRELTAINQSLSTLGNVIAALSSNKGHIPYRDSKLTRILQVRHKLHSIPSIQHPSLLFPPPLLFPFPPPPPQLLPLPLPLLSRPVPRKMANFCSFYLMFQCFKEN